MCASGARPRPGPGAVVLLRVVLHDQLLLDRRVDVGPVGEPEHGARQVVVVGLEPGRHRRRQVGRVGDDGLGRRPFAHRDDVTRGYLVRRDVHLLAVDREVVVPHELPALRPRGREAEPVDDVVEPQLEHAQEVLAGDAAAAAGLGVVAAELRLEHAVVAAHLLLLAQLEQVLGLLDAAAAVLARRVGAPLDGALLGQAALALQKELHVLAPALLALGPDHARHQTRLRFRGRTPLWACGLTSFTPRISRPAACSERMAISRPEPGPLTNTSTFCRPCSMPSRAAASAVTWAANGVDLRDPLKPTAPALFHTITPPSLSVSATSVLLNDVLMCAWPMAMFLRALRRTRPRVPPLRGAGGIQSFPCVTSCAACRRSSWDPCGCGRSCASAGRSPAARGDGAGRGSSRSP